MTTASSIELISGALLGALAIVVGLLGARRSRCRAEFAIVARGFGARVAEALVIPGSKRSALGFEIDDGGARALVYLRSTVAGDAISVLVPRPSLPRLTVRRRRAVDRAARWTGLELPLRAGDVDFDRRTHLETEETDALVQSALDPPGGRAAILNALDTLDEVSFDDSGVTGTSRISRRGCRGPEPARLRRSLELIRKLAAAAPDVLLDPSRRRRSARGDRAWLAVGIVAATGYGCLLLPRVRAGLWALMWFEDFLTSRLIALVLALVLAAGSYRWLRGHPRALRNFVRFNAFVALAALLPAPLAMYGCNAVFDRSPSDAHMVEVVGKRRGEGVLALDRVTFRIWDRPIYKKTIPTSRDVFESVELKDWILVTTRKGALGWEWVESVSKHQ